MRETELGRLFTPAITSALEEGYAIAPNELRGSYGRTNPIVLAKGSSRIVLWLEWESRYGRGHRHEQVTAHVSSIELGRGKSLGNDYRWPDSWRGHDVSSVTMYRVDDSYFDAWYSDDEADLEEAAEVRRVREEMRHVDPQPEVEVSDRAWSVIHRLRGFKRARREDVRLYKLRNACEWVINDTSRDACATISHVNGYVYER